MTVKLRMVGFCGVDDSVHPELLALISRRYPWIEWGVLFRPDMEGQPRYATQEWVQRLSLLQNRGAEKGMRLAGHLCGERCQQVLDGDGEFVAALSALGFGRVQINATAANKVFVDPAKLSVYAGNLLQVMASAPDVEFIFQLNDETRGIWDAMVNLPTPRPAPANVSVLFDASCGLGVEASEYPSPLPDIPCGYAGGIGPSNIADVLVSVEAAAQDEPIWIDMESSLRVLISDNKAAPPKDAFSIDKAFTCVLAAERFFLAADNFFED